MSNWKFLRLIPLLPFVFVLCGCDQQVVQDGIKKYNVAVQKSVVVLQTYYQQINDEERAQYFRRLRYSPGERMSGNLTISLDTSSPDGTVVKVPTGLLTIVQPDQIQARTSAITAMGAYASGLATLASNDAADRTETAILQAKAPITDALKQIKTLESRYSKASKTSIDISAFGGPVTDMVAIISGAWVAHMKDQAIKENALKGQPLITKLSSLLKDDVRKVNDQYEGMAQETASLAAAYYNRKFAPTAAAANSNIPGKTQGDVVVSDVAVPNPDPPNEDKRVALLPEIRAEFDRLAFTKESNPSALLDDMKQVNDDLVGIIQDGASDRQKVQDMYADLQQFTADADRIAGSLSKWQDKSKSIK